MSEDVGMLIVAGIESNGQIGRVSSWATISDEGVACGTRARGDEGQSCPVERPSHGELGGDGVWYEGALEMNAASMSWERGKRCEFGERPTGKGLDGILDATEVDAELVEYI